MLKFRAIPYQKESVDTSTSRDSSVEIKDFEVTLDDLQKLTDKEQGAEASRLPPV